MHTSVLVQALVISIFVFLSGKRFSGVVKRWLRSASAGKGIVSAFQTQDRKAEQSPNQRRGAELVQQKKKEDGRDLLLFKDLFYKLQNLEKFPETLVQARDLLISFLAEALELAQHDEEPGILDLEEFSREGLIETLQTEHDNITHAWEAYVNRRRAGGPTEMFKDQQECLWWLKQVAPVKYVDGAWLGHINKVTTPFNWRAATKDAWQVMSEELGDGMPVMNHVYVYRELMKEIGAGLPDGDDQDFIHPRHGMHEETPWKAAVAQLLISLFPHEFLPEILGFNMHFEGLTIETMKAAKEVEELGLNAYYFILHISIDNAESGHTAIAMQAVIKYLEAVRDAEGKEAEQRAWRRVQAGFCLSKYLSIGPEAPSKQKPASEIFPRNTREAEVLNIFVAKAPVAHKIHCTSRVKLGGRTLVDWLEPRALASKQWQLDFMDALANFKPWVRKGDSRNSKLMHLLSWDGKMFGSFTQNEVEVVRSWIDGLGRPDASVYWSFIRLTATKSEDVLADVDVRADYPVFSRENPKFALRLPSKAWLKSTTSQSLPDTSLRPLLKAKGGFTSDPDMTKLLPLWYAHQSLLEAFVNVPSKTTSQMASSIVRILRAQYGFDREGYCVAGMDEARRIDTAGLVEMGHEMLMRIMKPKPEDNASSNDLLVKNSLKQRTQSLPCRNLKEVLDRFPSTFATQMLHLSMRPMENTGFLLGLSWAFVGLHELASSSSSSSSRFAALLSQSRRDALVEMSRREREGMQVCFAELKKQYAAKNGEAIGDGGEDSMSSSSSHLVDFFQGFELGQREILGCFTATASSS